MKTILYILLGLSLGAGLTLIVLQERFVRERRRLLALGESQRAKDSQAAMAVLNKQWEQKYQQQAEEMQACQAQLAVIEMSPAVPGQAEIALRQEHERLLLEKNAALDRLTAEQQSFRQQWAGQQEEIKDLQGQLTFLTGEIERLKGEKVLLTDDDFLLLGQPGGHLLPGSVVRAFIKGPHLPQTSSQPEGNKGQATVS
jgi:hypothetical protein